MQQKKKKSRNRRTIHHTELLAGDRIRITTGAKVYYDMVVERIDESYVIATNGEKRFRIKRSDGTLTDITDWRVY